LKRRKYRIGRSIPKTWHHIGEDRPYMETTTHRQRAEIATEKRSPFRPHRGLAVPDLFLDTTLHRRAGETHQIDCTESLGNIYRNISQTCCLKGKTYRDAQLGELIHSIAVEHCRSMKSSVGVNPQGRSTEKMKLLLSGSHLNPPSWRAKCRSGLRDFLRNYYKSSPRRFVDGGTKTLDAQVR
jgi:hypothetical protein